MPTLPSNKKQPPQQKKHERYIICTLDLRFADISTLKYTKTAIIRAFYKYINVQLTGDMGRKIIYRVGTFYVPTNGFMPNYIITPTNLELLLQLGKSAQFTLTVILQQANGAYEVKIDRSNLDTAEKQKLKRGLQQLDNKKIISHVQGSRGTYKIDPSIITYSTIHTSTSSLSTSKSPFNTTSAPTSKKKPKEPYGNEDIKQVNIEHLIKHLQENKESAKQKKRQDQKSAAIEDGMWEAIKNYRHNRTYNVNPIYANLSGKDTTKYIEACNEFIDEITNETRFYDLANRVEHKNNLCKQFSKSVGSYDNHLKGHKAWNILIELGEIRRIANHSPHCLDLAAKSKTCTCFDTCRKKFLPLVNNDVKLAKLDNDSLKEHSDLHSHFEDWVSNNYPELLV